MSGITFNNPTLEKRFSALEKRIESLEVAIAGLLAEKLAYEKSQKEADEKVAAFVSNQTVSE